MIDVATLQGWIEALGYRAELEEPSTLCVRPRAAIVPLPPFYVQCTENWVILSMFDVFGDESRLRSDLPHRLLEANRDMRLAKFAFGTRDEVVLCAELPTEALDQSELADAVERIITYATTYRRLLDKPA